MWFVCKFYTLIVLLSFFNPFCFLLNNPDIKLCGFKQSCNQKESSVQLQATSCCMPCECTNICKERGTCCDDKEGLNETGEVLTQECIRALYLPVAMLDGDFGVRSYFARTRCPFAFKDDQMRDKCENAKPKSLQDLAFVSSEDGQIIYKNRFCALCHNEKKVVAWEINAFKVNKCWRIMEDENVKVESVTDFLLSNCATTFKAPINIDVHRVRCYDESMVIKRCNETGKWDVYDSDTEKLCENKSGSVYFIKHDVYENLYCYLCNTKANYQHHICTRTDKTPTDPTFAIINLVQWANRHSSEENKCKTDEIYDTHFSRCKKLYCPLLSLSVDGKCTPFIDIGHSYLLILRLVPLDIVMKSESLKKALDNQLPKIQRQLGFGECELCSGILYTERNILEANLEEVIVHLHIKQRHECKLKDIWSKFTLLEQNATTITMNLMKRNIRFIAYWDNKMSIIKTKVEVIFTSGKRNPQQCRIIQPERGLYCPKVLLTRREYKTVLKNHPNVNDLLIIPNTDDTNGTVFVCVDNYLSEGRLTTGKSFVLLNLTIAISFFQIVMK